MPQYKVNLARKPTSANMSVVIAANTAAEAVQKVQKTHGRDNLILNAEPTAFKVSMARRPTVIDRNSIITAANPQAAVQQAEKQNSGFIATGVLEMKR